MNNDKKEQSNSGIYLRQDFNISPIIITDSEESCRIARMMGDAEERTYLAVFFNVFIFMFLTLFALSIIYVI